MVRLLRCARNDGQRSNHGQGGLGRLGGLGGLGGLENYVFNAQVEFGCAELKHF